MSRYRIVVDTQRCEANAICMQAAPELFDIGDDDVAHPLMSSIGDAELAVARDAVERCPLGAIEIVPTAGG